MESRIQGNRGRRTYGDIVSGIMCGAKFGDTALAAVEIFRTDGAGSGIGYMQTQPQYGGMQGGVQASGIPGAAEASKKFPLFLQIFAYVVTAFDGTAPALTLVETNLDGTGAANVATFSGGGGTLFTFANTAGTQGSAFKVLTTDKIYKLTYTIATGGPTVGEAYYFIKLAGPGIQNQPVIAATQTIGP